MIDKSWKFGVERSPAATLITFHKGKGWESGGGHWVKREVCKPCQTGKWNLGMGNTTHPPEAIKTGSHTSHNSPSHTCVNSSWAVGKGGKYLSQLQAQSDVCGGIPNQVQIWGKCTSIPPFTTHNNQCYRCYTFFMCIHLLSPHNSWGVSIREATELMRKPRHKVKSQRLHTHLWSRHTSSFLCCLSGGVYSILVSSYFVGR